MTENTANGQTAADVDKTPIAGFWRRVAAFLIDATLLGGVALLLGMLWFPWAASLGQAGRLVGFVAALLYFGLFNSRLTDGQTPGKMLLRIRVVDRAGEALSPARSVLRFLVLAIPYFLNGLWFESSGALSGVAGTVLSALLVFVVAGGLGAIAYLYVFNRRTRQSLHDLVVGSFVILGPPAALPASLATPRLHRMVAAGWLALALIGAAVESQMTGEPGPAAPSNSVDELQAAIKSQLGVRRVAVTTGWTKAATTRSGESTITYLRVDAVPGDAHRDLKAVVNEIAGIVLDRHPDLLGNQILVVRTWFGFDLGIAGWSQDYQGTLDAASWRKQLALSPGGWPRALSSPQQGNSPVATSADDAKAVLAVEGYVRETHSWPKESYRIELKRREGDVLTFWVIHGEDMAAMKGSTVVGGGKSFAVDVDAKGPRVVRTWAFQ